MSTAEILAELPRLSPAERGEVRAKLDELGSDVAPPVAESIRDLPFVGIWKDRTDLPDDSVEASRILRQRMMRRVSDKPTEGVDA